MKYSIYKEESHKMYYKFHIALIAVMEIFAWIFQEYSSPIP